jgi:hypothetical protein
MKRRTDKPVRRTYVLSEEACRLVDALEDHFTLKEKRPVSKSEVVEIGVRRLAKVLTAANGGSK